MKYTFSIIQFGFRLLFLILDIVINIQILSTQQPLTFGAITIGTDYIHSIVIFNAAVIIIILIVDFMIVAARRYRINFEVGNKFIDVQRYDPPPGKPPDIPLPPRSK